MYVVAIFANKIFVQNNVIHVCLRGPEVLSYWKRPPWQIVGTVCRGQTLWSLRWKHLCCDLHQLCLGAILVNIRTKKRWHDCYSDYVNMVHGSFGRSYDPHLLIIIIWQERSEVYFLANSVTRFHCSAVKWYTSCLNLWLCLDFSGFHQNCPPRRFVTIELLIPAVQPTRTAFLTLRYQKSVESQYQTMSCWCNHTPFDCHNFGACFYLDMT